jgi:hypothetical protein
MIPFVTGLFGVLLAGAFFAYYAIMLDRAPLWVILVGALILGVSDYVRTMKEERGKRGNGNDQSANSSAESR